MRKLSALFIILVGIMAVNCSSSPKPRPAPQVRDTEYCSFAEEHLIKLGCIASDHEFTKKGKSFTDFCIESQNNGIFLNPICLGNVKSCDESEWDACMNVESK